MNYLKFWLAKALADFLIFVGIVAVIFVGVLISAIGQMLRKPRKKS